MGEKCESTGCKTMKQDIIMTVPLQGKGGSVEQKKLKLCANCAMQIMKNDPDYVRRKEG